MERRSPGASSTVTATAAPIASPATLGRGSSSGSSRPSSAKSAQSSRSAAASNRDRTVTVRPGSRDAAKANVPRRPGGASAGAWRITPATSVVDADSCQAPAGAGVVGSAAGSCQVNMIPTVSGSGPGFSDPPLEDADRQGAGLEVPGDDRAQLLADEADAKDVGLEGLPCPREQGVIRPAAYRQRPAPVRQGGGPKRRQDRRACRPRRVARRRRRSRRPPRARTRGARPRGASARSRRGGSGRCCPCPARRSGCRRMTRRRSSDLRRAGGRRRGRGGPWVAARRRPG